MKKYFLYALLMLTGATGFSQTDTSLIYLRFPIVPAFKLINIADSSIFTKETLKKKKPTIIMMFSPDCEHCQAETKELTAKIGLFKKAQIVMVSPIDFNYMKEFYNEYKIADFSNITMGRDPTYFLGTFFNDIHITMTNKITTIKGTTLKTTVEKFQKSWQSTVGKINE